MNSCNQLYHRTGQDKASCDRLLAELEQTGNDRPAFH